MEAMLNFHLAFGLRVVANGQFELGIWNLVWRYIINISRNFDWMLCITHELQIWWWFETLRLYLTNLTQT